MQLITTIPPRKDGTVVVKSLDNRTTFIFKPDEANQLACDVDDEPTVAHLLRSESFYPADEADFSAAMQLANLGDGADDDGDAGSDGPPDDEDDEGSADGAPVESGTQPVIATPAAVSRARARNRNR